MPKDGSGWIPADLYATIQRSIPIACVDVVPYRSSGALTEVLLIRRDTAGQGLAWCFVGGRVLYGEDLLEAVHRQVLSTLGEGLNVLDIVNQPQAVVQYLPRRAGLGAHDPRQHSLGLTFLVEVDGTEVPLGEAFDVQWFRVTELPRWGSVNDLS